MFDKKTKISSLLVGTALVGMTASTANASFTFGSLSEAAESLFLKYFLPAAVAVRV